MIIHTCLDCGKFNRHYVAGKYQLKGLKYGGCAHSLKFFNVDDKSICKHFVLRDNLKDKNLQLDIILRDLKKMHRELTKLLLHAKIVSLDDF